MLCSCPSPTPSSSPRPARRRLAPACAALHGAVLAAVALAGVGCGPPEQATLRVRGLDLVVNAEAIRVLRAGDELLRVPAGRLGSKEGFAGFDMQFGMFNIEEDPRPFQLGERIAIEEVGTDTIRFAVIAGDGVVLRGTLGPGPDKGPAPQRDVARPHAGVRLSLQAAARHNRVIAATRCAPDHHFIGLGAQTHDVDHRGQRVPLWVSEQGIGKEDTNDLPLVWQVVGRRHTTHAPMPAFLRSDAVAFVADSTAFARFDFCATQEDELLFEVWDNTLALDLLPGSTPLAAIEAQQKLTAYLGRPRPLAPYVHAPWNDAIFSEANVRAFADFLRDSDIPSSVIWSEDWRGGQDAGQLYRLDEDWRLDRQLYPTYEDMAARLREQGIAHQVYFNAFVTQSGDVAAEIAAAGYDIRDAITGDSFLFNGPDRNFSATALLDLTNPDARAYMRDEHLREALRLGAAGWMADYAEWMPVDGVVLHSGEDPALVHNNYPVLFQSLNLEAVTLEGRLDDAIIFYRSAHLGSPSLVDVFWAGDQRTSFDLDDGLPTILPLGIGTAATGFMFFAHDIAGYQSSTNSPADKQLFFRWTSLGAFSPVMRTHHGTHARFNHNLQSDEETTALWRRYAEIHTRLYPYARALGLAATASDVLPAAGLGAGFGPLPLWVPQPLLFPEHAPSWGLMDQVFFGPSLLVAPVVTRDAVRRDVVFPPGRFVPFPMPGAPVGSLGRSRAVFTGPTTASVEAPDSEIPVFVRAGGIVPMTALPAQTLLEVDDPRLPGLASTRGDREVVVALGADGVFEEEDRARYELVGSGTQLPAGVDDDGAVTRVGDGLIEGPGFTLVLSGHPATRRIRVVFR